jgi:hypothetical protein
LLKRISYQIRVNYPFFGGDKAVGRRQMAEGRKEFRQKGGYQGGFGISNCYDAATVS